ncbi:hypothetical protein DPMN_089698 [Dreissena polymorpha]|uniref:Uncharacterized protein n=1 Tax=Dreissena polymorpha TaxID=45954 RepID=A0A9D4KYD0_DREPO|nr:hypothetical protein DPMN_089698 [Dreissena polymorpha]
MKNGFKKITQRLIEDNKNGWCVEEPRMFDGNEFQSLGAAYMKLRSPNDTDLIFVGITNEVASFFDLKFRLGS